MFGLARQRIARRAATLAAASCAALIAATPAGAATTPARATAPTPQQPISWSLQPATVSGLDGRTRFTYLNFEAGGEHGDHYAVRNFTGHSETFVVYAADAVNMANGAVNVLSGPTPSTGFSAWVHIPRSRVTVPAGKIAILPFSVTVPRNAIPGFHVGALVASLQTTTTDARGQKIRVDYRVGSRIYLQVAGALTPMLRVERVHLAYDNSPLAVKGGPAVVNYTVVNTGNVPLKGTADIRVGGPFGLFSSTAHQTIPELLPGSRLALVAHVCAVLAAVHVTATVTVHPVATVPGLLKEPASASGSDAVWVIPWWLLIAIGVVSLLVWLRRRRLYRDALRATDVRRPQPHPGLVSGTASSSGDRA